MITKMQKLKPTVLAPWTRQAQITMEKIAPISMLTPMMKIPPDVMVTVSISILSSAKA